MEKQYMTKYDYPQTYLKNTKLSDLAWLSGSWCGQVGQDVLELQYSQPRYDSIMGMFRWIKEETVQFYEFILLELDGVVE